VILVAAATIALATPSREELVHRWLAANHAHSIAKLGSAPAAKSVAAPDLEALVRRELNAPGRYRIARPALPSEADPWWLRGWHWFTDRWQQFWNALFGRAHIGKGQAASIGDVLLVAVALLLGFVLIRLLRDLQFTRRSAAAQIEPLTERASPRALYNSACDAAARGDYGTAALVLFRAFVLLLDRRGTVTVTSSATVGDVRRALRARGAALVTSFDTVAAPFVQRAYAERPISEPQWSAAEKAFVALSLGPARDKLAQDDKGT